MHKFNHASIRHELIIDAHAIGIPIGSAEIFIDRTLSAAEHSLKSKSIITENDFKGAIAKELQKYHADLAYVYKNRDKII